MITRKNFLGQMSSKHFLTFIRVLFWFLAEHDKNKNDTKETITLRNVWYRITHAGDSSINEFQSDQRNSLVYSMTELFWSSNWKCTYFIYHDDLLVDALEWVNMESFNLESIWHSISRRLCMYQIVFVAYQNKIS